MINFTSESGIYIIKNVRNGKCYIGSSVNLKKRTNEHKRDLKKMVHHSSKLQRSWNKHGRQHFIFDLVELVLNKDNLIEREQFWIDLYDSYKYGYNATPIAGSNLGTKRSDESKAKMSAAQTGKILSKESISKRTATQAANKLAKMELGIPRKTNSKEHIAKIVATRAAKRLDRIAAGIPFKVTSKESIIKREETKAANRLAKIEAGIPLYTRSKESIDKGLATKSANNLAKTQAGIPLKSHSKEAFAKALVTRKANALAKKMLIDHPEKA